MGGLVFAYFTNKDGDAVRTPRMPPTIYNTVLQKCRAKLEPIFERVVVPRDAPGKVDYGDIDFLVGGIRLQIELSDIWTVVKDAFGAELEVSRGDSHSFAISHPTEPDAYVQVDVELSPGDGTPDGAELFAWTRFMKGDSDLLQILGVLHRSLGLTCTARGLHLRVAEIEPYNKKKALLFLSRDPDTVIRFYGLDTERYWAGFVDEKDIFDWTSRGRFFSPNSFEHRVEKHNDRARQAKRPMYRRFVEEYMPACADESCATATWTRPEVLHEALKTFKKQAEYDRMMLEHHQKEAEENLWTDVRSVLPVVGNSLSLALKSLRRWVVFEQGQPALAQQPNLENYAWWTMVMAEDSRQDLLAWVRLHWEEARSMEKTRSEAAKEAARQK